jgi:hypothetical protein
MKQFSDRVWRLSVALAPFVAFALTLVASKRWF